ncbi:MAG TPA: aminotransferase DegT [Bacteroidales bacterium]|jgi:dTDP-4-amino-4,6-dideoxygalactose transaminase|nr:aminotransferase DegT [Bacteroidales bacterium]
MSYKVFQLEPYVGQEELANLTKSINDGWLTEGPFSKKFIEGVKDMTGAKHALLAANGTLALYLMYLAIGIEPGDEVICPSFTFNATASPLAIIGAKPVFVDIKEDDLQIDPEMIEAVITPKTKAIVPVHIYGQSCDMDPIMEIAKKHNLLVIEDAAQGFGVFYKEKHTGTIGHCGMISFFADKTITCGEGAVVLTNDDELFEKLKLVRNQGRPNSGTFIHPSLGMNFRMTDLQCGVGVAQLAKFPEIKERKTKNFELYHAWLKDVPQVKFVGLSKDSNFIPFRVNIRVERLEELLQFMEDNQLQTRRLFYPLHKQPCYSYLGYQENDFPVANKAYDEGLSLPVHLGLKREDIELICDTIISFYG